MLEIKGLRAGYPGQPVLRDVTLTAPAGALTAILGPNGCGKTTLLKVLCGILRPDAGKILLDGMPLPAKPAARARKLAYLSQSRRTPDITAGQLVLHGRFPYLHYPRRYRQEDYAAADKAMAQLGICGLADTPLEKLSGGQRQKVYIAMALAQDAPVVLLDEPATYLDVGHQLQLMQLAKDLARKGKTVITVMHDLSLALENADRVAIMADGRVCMSAAPEEVFASGCLDRIFGITLERLHTPDGPHYYCK